MRTRTHVYSGFERFWHWTQAALILFLALSGFEVHGSFTFLGFDQAVRYINSPLTPSSCSSCSPCSGI